MREGEEDLFGEDEGSEDATELPNVIPKLSQDANGQRNCVPQLVSYAVQELV